MHKAKYKGLNTNGCFVLSIFQIYSIVAPLSKLVLEKKRVVAVEHKVYV
jgi:hypothetical protein